MNDLMKTLSSLVALAVLVLVVGWVAITAVHFIENLGHAREQALSHAEA